MITNSSSTTSSSYKTSTTSDPSPTKKSENPSNFSPDENTKSYFSSSKNSSLPPLGVYQSANEETLADLESVNKKITDLSENNNQSINDIFALMALFAEIGRITKSSAFMQRESKFQEQINSLQASVADMKDAAQARFAAGITSGVMQGVGAAAQIGLSASALNQSAKGATIEKASLAPDYKGDPIKAGFSPESLLGHQYNSYATASGTLGSAASTIGSTSGNSFADAAEKKKFDKETNAKISEKAVSRSDESYRTASELTADILAKLRDLVAAIEASMNSLNRNI
jgi:hypothetical protein